MRMLALFPLAMAFSAASLPAQFISDHPTLPRQKQAQSVEFIAPLAIQLPAARPARVQLQFRIAPGLHINSHTPHDTFLIPTALTLAGAQGVRLESVSYPKGHDVTLPVDPKTKLEVYTDLFALDAILAATPGHHTVQASLRYQACDQNQCRPPSTLPVTLEIEGR